MRRNIIPLLFLILFASCNKANDATPAPNILTFKADGVSYSFTPTVKKTDTLGQYTLTITGTDASGMSLRITLLDLYFKVGIYGTGSLTQTGNVIQGVTMVLNYPSATGVGRTYSSLLVPGGKSVGAFVIRYSGNDAVKAEFTEGLPIVSGSGADTTRISEGNVEVTLP